MTIPFYEARRVVNNTGSVTDITLNFKAESAADVHLYAGISADEDLPEVVELVQGVDYTLTGIGVVGLIATLTNPAGWSNYARFALQVKYAVTQPNDVDVGGPFGQRFEDALDRQTFMLQSFFDDVSRSIKVPVTATVGTDNTLTPAPSQLIGWNSEGTGFENYPTVTQSIQDAIDAADDAEAAALLAADYANLALNNWSGFQFTGDGVTTDYALAVSPGSINNVIVVLGGIWQNKSTVSLVEVLGVTYVRFSTAPLAGVEGEILYGNRTTVGVPPDGSISAAKMQPDAIATTAVQNDAITLAKMQNIATSTLLGRVTAGTGDPEVLTASVAADMVGKATWSLDNNTLYKSRSIKDRWLDSYRLTEELNFTGGGSVATDAAVLQALFNRAVAAGRGELILPRGDIRLEAVAQVRNPSATKTIRIVGQGPDATRIQNNAAAQHFFDVGDASIARTSKVIFENLSLEPAVAMNDSGVGFNLRNTSDIAFKNVNCNAMRNGWSLGVGAGVTNDAVYTTLSNCGGTSAGASGVAMIRLGSGGILNISGGASRWNANGGHRFVEHDNTSWNWDGFYLSGQFFEFWQKYLLSTGKGMVNVEWTGCQVDRADIFFHAEPSIAAGSNRNWNIHDVQMLGFTGVGGGIGCLFGKGSSTDTQGIECMTVNDCVFNGLSDAALYAPNGELFAKHNLITSCAMLGGAAPLGGSLIRIGQGMCKISGNTGRRALNSPGVAYVTGIQWDGASLATRKAEDNDFFSFSGAAETGTK